jgi:poly(A) polymerase
MPIITPAYPCINSTHNISPTTSAVIKQEFTRGAQMVLRLAPDAQPHIVESVLKGLVAPHEFFTQYRHFLDITIASASDKDMDKWYGWCESKLRQFIRGLEIARGAGTAAGATPPFTVHPRPGGVPDPDKPSTFHFYFGLDIARNEQGQLVCIDLSTATTAFTTLIEGKDDRKETDTIAIGLLKASQLPAFVFPDEKRPAGWGEKKKRKRKTVASDAAASASASASAAADAGDSKADASPSEAVAAANKPLPASSSNDTTASATSTTSTTSTATDTVVTITSASTSTSAPAPAVSPAGSMPDEDQPAVKRAKVDA